MQAISFDRSHQAHNVVLAMQSICGALYTALLGIHMDSAYARVHICPVDKVGNLSCTEFAMAKKHDVKRMV